ncbi:unnamed protein product [Aureobasidium uvarum]|uniref:BZIP domain-containing protein n=1 Tax=Aureobasidium uvarum TaxID=2773716 RepID=A0A9N8KCL2_9PEZI|nr:unnamed protein product [Aureobasidium uvarum]
MSLKPNYQVPESLFDMESTLTTTFTHNDQYLAAWIPDSVDSMSVLGCSTASGFFQDDIISTPTVSLNSVGPSSDEGVPMPNLLPSWSTDFNSSKSLTSTSNLTWADESGLILHDSKSKSTGDATAAQPQRVVKTRARGRPRKGLSKDTGGPKRSDSLDECRAKNRKASARCREKERGQAAALEKAVQEQEERSSTLKQTATALQEELFCLQMQALQHVNCGCRDVHSYNEQRALVVATAWDLV